MYLLELIGEDDGFAAYEAACLASGVEVIAPGVARATALGDRIGQVAYTRAISRFIADSPAVLPTMAAALRAADHDTMAGSAAVRARAIRGADVDTQAVERALGSVLVEEGFDIDLDDPDHVLRAVVSAGRCFLGWLVQAPEQGFPARQPTDRPFFRPGSMAPRDARALVNVAGAGPGRRLLDPLCGTGGFLLEAGLVDATVIGGDVDPTMVRGTRDNLDAVCPDATRLLVAGDAMAMPFRNGSADVVVTDLPYGRQSPIAGRNAADVAAGVLRESARVARRAVIVADRPLRASLPDNWVVCETFQRRVHRSLTRHIHLVGPVGTYPAAVSVEQEHDQSAP